MAIIALSILCVLLLAALIYRERTHSKHIESRERSWDLERGGLLNRIQHPQVFQVPTAKSGVPAEVARLLADEKSPDEIDESALVGTIQPGGPIDA